MAELKTTDLKSFHYLENGDVTFSSLDTVKTSNRLEAGSYDISYVGHPIYSVTLKKSSTNEEVKTHSFPDKDKINNIMKAFFNPSIKEKIIQMGFNHKLGVLFHGKEGTGKSTIMKYYYSGAINNNSAIVFHINTVEYLQHVWEFIVNIRNIQDNPIIIVFDEFDDYFGGPNGKEAYIKKMLDGNLSINNCIYFASTNYLEAIPDAIKNRPSRFKYNLNIEGVQDVDEVYKLLKTMLLNIIEDSQLKKMAKTLSGQSLDSIKQFCFDKIMNLKDEEIKKNKLGFKINAND